jgi:2-keto-3-deoxy-L-rhamnonate aldolase
MPSAPPRGVYAPVTVFFNEDGSIDIASLREHIARLGRGGLRGLVISGSNGEAVHLSRQERIDVIRLARTTLDSLELKSLTIIAGCGVHGTSETIQLCKDATRAGAEFALVLPPSYWAGAMNKGVLSEFFKDASNSGLGLFPSPTNVR